MFINEVGNEVASKAVDVAVNYIKKNPNLGLSVEIMAVEGNRSDSKGLLEASEEYLISTIILNILHKKNIFSLHKIFGSFGQ